MIISLLLCVFSFTTYLLVFQILSPISIFVLLFVASLRDILKGKNHISKLDVIETVCLACAVIFGILYVIPLGIKGSRDYLYFIDAGFLAVHVFLVFPIRFNETRKKLKHSSKKAVSRNKARYQKDGFDLDLTYITNRCIAMSLPAERLESIYRNPIREVVRFFDTKYPDCYRIYNLCNERDYDPKYFHGNVKKYPIPDHNVPKLETMCEFSKDVIKFHTANLQNVVAVHCKGGKGRTGCMICAYLLASGVCKTADEALRLFADKRTIGEVKNQGVTCPSQKRFVHYFGRFIKDNDILNIKDEELDKLFEDKYSKELPKMKDFRFRIVDYSGKQLYTSHLMNNSMLNKNKITLEANVKVRNEFRFEMKGKFYLWQNSYFINEREIYNKHEIDGICNNPNYSDNFFVEFTYKI